MKKVITMAAAVLMVVSAAAQNTKLNFEAPLFGVTKKNVKPALSVVVFSEVSGGYSHRLNAPAEVRPSGHFMELNLVELRYRPWRNGNLFSWGLSYSMDFQPVLKGTMFSESGDFIPKPERWLSARATVAEQVTSLKIGYTREFGDWRASLFVSPGIGYGIRHNQYTLGTPFPKNGTAFEPITEDTEVIYLPGFRAWDSRSENSYGNQGFRLGIQAGLWYRSFGLTAGWHLRSIAPGNQNGVSVGVSIRY